MIFLRIFIDRIPDTWNPETVWMLAGLETLVEAFLVGLLVLFIRIILQ